MHYSHEIAATAIANVLEMMIERHTEDAPNFTHDDREMIGNAIASLMWAHDCSLDLDEGRTPMSADVWSAVLNGGDA